MSIPVFEARQRTSPNRVAGVFYAVSLCIMIPVSFLIGIGHLIALPFIIAADKSFASRVERKHRREAVMAGKQIARREYRGF